MMHYTYADLYAAYAPAHQANTPGQGPYVPWTVEELVAILEAYVEERGHYPPYEDLHPDCGLPHRTVIRRICGSVQAWYALVPCPLPVRHCLKCGRVQDRWVCLKCHWKVNIQHGEMVEGDGAWMSGTVLRDETGGVDAYVLEMVGLGPVYRQRKERRKRG